METCVFGGVAIPRIGLGTFRMTGNECRMAVESALELGYRSIDTAEMYGNEEMIGDAIVKSRIARADLHLTTKVWHTNLTPEGIRDALARSLSRLQTDYVDLYLVHWPSPEMNFPAVFDTLQTLANDGRIRAIGVCNFTMPMIRKVVEELAVPVVGNQVEYHPLLDQTPMREYLVSRGLLLTAHCPLAQGTLVNHPLLREMARRYDASPAQIALRWLLAHDGVIVIPKASRRETQLANLRAFDIMLDADDVAAIDALPKNQRFVDPPFAPAWDPSPC